MSPAPTPQSNLIAKCQQILRQFALDANAEIACPVCQALGLKITDQSARPHVEWHRFQCGQCDFDETLSISLGHTNTLDIL